MIPTRAIRGRGVLLTAVLVTVATTADATTRYVAANGADVPGCGTKKSPCRSIGAALDAAAGGDKIVVGPGRYGDANNNGALGDPGDERGLPFCGCLLGIDKAVTITSSHGAAATIIDAQPFVAPRNILFVTNDATFGAPGHGFTVTRTGTYDGVGIAIANGAMAIKIAGNLVNAASRNEIGGSGIATLDDQGAFGPGPVVIESNLVTGGWESGIRAVGATTTVRKNQASQNDSGIKALSGSVIGNIADNNTFGIRINGAVTVTGNTVSSNQYGIFLTSPDAKIEKNNMLGSQYCGLYNQMLTDFPAINNFWGAATGPGADDLCNSNSTTITTPFATKPFKTAAPLKF